MTLILTRDFLSAEPSAGTLSEHVVV